jgi:hypothetical protein
MSRNSKRRKKQEAEKAAQQILLSQKIKPDLQNSDITEGQKQSHSIRWKKLQEHPGVMGIRFSWKLFWWSVCSIGAVIGLVVFFHPKIIVVPNVFIDPKNPITARFEIKNDGELPVYDVYAHSIWVPLYDENAPRFTFTSWNKFTEIKSGLSYVCHFDKFTAIDSSSTYDKLLIVDNYQIQIVIIYRPKFWMWNTTNTFEFTASKAADGNFVMTPYGGGQSVESFIKNPDLH